MTRLDARPGREELERARNKTLPDVLDHDLDVVFCGINPSLYSAATGHHFARPGNRFWRALHHSGFTDRELRAHEDASLLSLRIRAGLTNLASRPTAAASELTRDEIRAGVERLGRKLRRLRPRRLAILGVTAYGVAFPDREAKPGDTGRDLGGVPIWLLPNPSGRNAHYSLAELAREFAKLREAISRGGCR